MKKFQVQQWKKNGKWWKDVESFDNETEAKDFAKTVKDNRVVEFNR